MYHSKKNVGENDKSEIDFYRNIIMPTCNFDQVK